jgi:hypothetical protein
MVAIAKAGLNWISVLMVFLPFVTVDTTLPIRADGAESSVT